MCAQTYGCASMHVPHMCAYGHRSGARPDLPTSTRIPCAYQCVGKRRSYGRVDVWLPHCQLCLSAQERVDAGCASLIASTGSLHKNHTGSAWCKLVSM
eukprot:1161262-Pelagomonas_calceolata.AAC.14